MLKMLRLTATLATLAFALAACGQPADSTSSSGPPGASITPGTGAIPSATASLTTPPATAEPGCTSTRVTIAVGTPPPPACLAVGSTISFASTASALQPWVPVRSSDPAVLSCNSEQHDDGSVSGQCLARAAGTATMTTNTSAFSGDPAGPPQYRWQLTVTVVA